MTLWDVLPGTWVVRAPRLLAIRLVEREPGLLVREEQLPRAAHGDRDGEQVFGVASRGVERIRVHVSQVQRDAVAAEEATVAPPPGTAHLRDLAPDRDGWGLHPIGGADTELSGHKGYAPH